MNRSKWLTRINFLLFLLLLVGVGFVLFYPVNPLTINSVVVEGDEFKAGGELDFKVDRCKSVDEATDGTATRYLIDQKDDSKDPYFLSSTDDLGKQGCMVSNRKIVLPSHIPEGKYKLCFVVKYYPSVLRPSVKKEFCSDNSFNVKGLTVAAQLEMIINQLDKIDPEISAKVSRKEEGNKTMANAPNLQSIPQPSVPYKTAAPDTEMTEKEETNNDSANQIDKIIGIINSLKISIGLGY